MNKPIWFSLLFLMLLIRSGVMRAQSVAGPPLIGPIMATTSAAGDEIILYDIGGQSRRVLVLGPGQHTVWGFSPDGCRLLLTRNDPGGLAEMLTATLIGDDVRLQVSYPEMPRGRWGVWEPQWSPDGSRIAFTMIRDVTLLNIPAPQAEGDPYEYRVAWIPAEGGAPTFYSIAGDEHTPQWSPDGQWLAYVGYEARVPGPDPASTAIPTEIPRPGETPQALPLIREADLWVVRADASEKNRLTAFTVGSISLPRWSPDGSQIAFVYAPVGNNDTFWTIANQLGAAPLQLSYRWALIMDQVWQPDGAGLIAAARDFRGEIANRLWRIPSAGNADDTATLLVEDPALLYADFPRYSADGRWLALRSAYALALVDTTTGAWSLLDETALGNSPPVWSPPGFTGERACA